MPAATSTACVRGVEMLRAGVCGFSGGAARKGPEAEELSAGGWPPNEYARGGRSASEGLLERTRSVQHTDDAS
ncbi:hypothetical protein TRAPUB_8598 [Trametes pubescens]|uniref:Uncharacterized protein n=1 Tax=Trametes pubescens TaxID=154538 RepID=A0A1M2W4Q8_TRAPU|nr:hypothetical protein TRAPUB_8598 [Trametes pubescens]